MSSNKNKIWIVRNEGEQPKKVPIDFDKVQDLDDLKEILFGEDEKALYVCNFKGAKLNADANIAVNTTASEPLIFYKGMPVRKDVWIVRDEAQQSVQVPVDFDTVQDLDDLKEILFGEDEKALYLCNFKGAKLSADANIPVNTTASEPLIFYKGSGPAAVAASVVESSSHPPRHERPTEKLLRNATINSVGEDGYPTKYKITCQEVIISIQNRLRKCHVGEKAFVDGLHPLERTIMILGATGAGKSTMINGIVNYYYGVQWKDDFRFKLITEEDEGIQGVAKSQAKSQTTWITAYTLHHLPGCTVPYTLTLIDTPGYGDSDGIKRDAEITNQIRELFSDTLASGIDHIDAIGFVVQSSLARLTHTQKYVFDSVLSLFGKDVAENIMLIITFSDGQEPPVILALKAGGVPYGSYFKFNNSSLFAKNRSTGNESDIDANFDAMFWTLGYTSLKRFFHEFQRFTPVSLTLTKETLKERHRLETTVQGIQPQIQNGLSKLETLRQEGAILKKHANDIKDNKNFEYTVDVQKHRVVSLSSGTYVTNCLKCNYTCHFPCGIPDDKDKRGCSAMSGDNCTVCPGKCHWQQHKNNNFRYELYVVKEKRTYDDMLNRYKTAEDEFGTKTSIFEKLMDDFQLTHLEVLKLIAMARKAVQRIEAIALKANPLSVVSYIELMIESEKREAKPGFMERIRSLEIVKQQAELIQNMKDMNFDPFKKVLTGLDEFKDISIPTNQQKEKSLLSKFKAIFS